MIIKSYIPNGFFLIVFLIVPCLVNSTPAKKMQKSTNLSPSADSLMQKKPVFKISIGFSSALFAAIAGDGHFYDNTGFDLKFGAGQNNWKVFTKLEMLTFYDSSVGDYLKNTVLNIGLGFSKLYFKKQLKFTVCSGPSILLTNSLEHSKGDAGFFVDLKPAGFRFLFYSTVIEIYPVSFLWEMPAVNGVPILYLRYRFTLSAGFEF